MESGHLPDSVISASTSYNAACIPQFSRLNKIPASGKAGAWCAKSNDGNQWLQISFGRQTTATKVATQGRYDADQWVTSYSLSYSVDGAHWAWYRLSDGHIKVWLTRSEILVLWEIRRCISFWYTNISLPGVLKTLSLKYTSSVKLSKVANTSKKLIVQP